MTKRKYPVPNIGDQFGDWTVIDSTEEYIYPTATNLTRYTKGVLVECPHKIQRRRSVNALHSNTTTGCPKCGSKKKFKGKGNLSMSYLNSIIRGAKKRKLFYDVTPEYLWALFLDQEQKCALSGVDLKLDPAFSMSSRKRKKKWSQTASLDRINSREGYVEGNVQWVHKDVNLIKAALSQQKFIQLCSLVAKTHNVKPKTRIIARTQVEGIHRWAKCPIEEVDYLQNYHRHVFHITAKAYANHNDRDIEFIQLSHNIKQYLMRQYYSEQHLCAFFDNASCEMIAEELVAVFNLYECEVNEDGEGGALVRKL